MELFNDLNFAQSSAVQNVEGPSLIIAGAGSGKTRVLTYRIAHLLQKGVKPNTILALTFTNKAAKEMKERIAKLIGSEKAATLWMGTFHSIFAKILRFEAETIGYPANFTIYDTIDSKSLIRLIIKDLKLDTQIYKEGEVLHRISMAKNNLVTPAAYAADPNYIQNDKNARKPEIARIYQLYASRCRKAGSMDFDDLLMQTNILFRDKKEILEKYQKRFQYVLVDEYQDTNFSQYLILRKLAEFNKNICVVGDDAQSIYSFRGARIENILNFQKDYPGNKVYKLEQNYRSTKTIVNAANSIIAKNEKQLKKNVFSLNEEGEKIRVIQASTDVEEGYLIANSILDFRLHQNHEFLDFAILYRTNAQSRIFEETLRRLSIPYKIYGGISFYQRKEIKDVISYFRLSINHCDDEALKRVINYPRRGIGDTSLDKIYEAANSNNLPIWNIITRIPQYPLGLGSGVISKINEFVRMVHGFSAKYAKLDAFDMAKEIASVSGILKELFADKSQEGISRYENVEELLNGIKEFTDKKTQDNELITLDRFLEDVALLTNEDKASEQDRDKVTMMTIHSAKGLEFKSVYIVGVEEGLFPSQQSSLSSNELEEERRLFYVAVTRAEKNLVISCSKTRYKWGQLYDCTPSRFIREIDQNFLQTVNDPETKSLNNRKREITEEFDIENNLDLFNTDTTMLTTKSLADPYFSHKRLVKLKETVMAGSADSLVSDDNSKLKIGSQVEHQRFGYGKVTSIEGATPNAKATISFLKAGEKQLLLKFAKLKIIKG